MSRAPVGVRGNATAFSLGSCWRSLSPEDLYRVGGALSPRSAGAERLVCLGKSNDAGATSTIG
jgi:hypothetical protein